MLLVKNATNQHWAMAEQYCGAQRGAFLCY